MFKALHPTQSAPISIRDYIHLSRTSPSIGDARCPACEQPLLVKGDIDPKKAIKTHFAHRRDPTAPVCPIKSEGAIRYEVLTDALPDTEASVALRTRFFENWTYHWHQFKKYVRAVDIKDFASALRAVDTKGVWKYRDIEEHEVIIAMLATLDFQPVTDNKGKVLRSSWVRFWFRSDVANLQEFWNLGDGQKVMIRAEYELPAKATMIREDKFRDFSVLEVDSDYLENEAYAQVPEFVRIVMSERFPRMIVVPA